MTSLDDLVGSIGIIGAPDRPPKLPCIAVVTAISPIYVKFEGEDVTSTKPYKNAVPGYTAAVNDRVVMLPLGRTYVIIGKL